MPDPKLNSIKPPASPPLSRSSGGNCLAAEDQDTYEITRRHISNEDKHDKLDQEQEILRDSKQNREQRKEYANKIFWLVCAWLAVLTILVGMTGCGSLCLSDTVLVTLIGSASVNIIGLMVIVASYLFPKNGPPPRKRLQDKID